MHLHTLWSTMYEAVDLRVFNQPRAMNFHPETAHHLLMQLEQQWDASRARDGHHGIGKFASLLANVHGEVQPRTCCLHYMHSTRCGVLLGVEGW